jgi:hypothetical protein
MQTFPIGHYAIKLGRFDAYIARKILSHTGWTVKVDDGADIGSTDLWRKMTVLAIVPPEKVEQIETLLEAAYDEKRQKERTAKARHQIAVKNILKGYEVQL